MSMYEKLDELIVSAIAQGSHPLYNRGAQAEAERIAKLTGRDEMRITDGRMTALKKAGVIRFVRGKKAHWEVV